MIAAKVNSPFPFLPMIPSLIIIAALLVTAAVLYLHNRLYYGRRPGQKDSGEAGADTPASAAPAPRPDGCCGLHEVCLKAEEAAADNLLYFDDEELDEFRGRNAGAYDDAETDRFREVLLTLPHDEVLAWTAALEKRGIALPAALRDEVLILLS